MKYVFVYFRKKALCATPEEAAKFINSLTFHDNGRDPLVCNAQCYKRLRGIFEGGALPAEGLSPAGSSGTSVKVFPALGGTIEEHERAYRERAERDRQARMAANAERIGKIKAALAERRVGRYYYALDYTYVDVSDPMLRFRTGTAEGTEEAESGYDLYRKAVDRLMRSMRTRCSFLEPREAYSNGFTFQWLGE